MFDNRNRPCFVTCNNFKTLEKVIVALPITMVMALPNIGRGLANTTSALHHGGNAP